ncbi:hypothetical protein SAMN00017477_1013 [Peptoniphilus asaccharolyticus DSM 20463]|uniref:Uncharacterized protein n=1 Tax=Peptoniphilus asaccharolyticus DSM 20463 TaxID=573058 RepID=A0A1W1V225_PEPAS|nr:hypothetical protein [Peptoniphilus asaccharolyticus]MBL7575509.1 hypothetical protein [Peptoniphilus asaccharolyticus]SMB87071.1 hypothetical protein SAMN00017477_1013 [Peptoniphilus asaccharolyticus DSM 20463]
MIPVEQLSKRAKKLHEDISSANIYIDGVKSAGNIIKKTVNENIVKVFVSLSVQKGTVTKVEIIDKDGDILQTQDMEIIKNTREGFIAVIEIRVENEVLNGKH